MIGRSAELCAAAHHNRRIVCEILSRRLVAAALCIAGLVCCTVRSVDAQPAASGGSEVLPLPPQPFRGTIGLKAKESKSDFPQPVKAPTDAPNVLLVLLDDVGFGASSTFGGPCTTETLERVAKSGVRYNQFHTTALCSPSRAALLTGRNHHTAHTACIMEAGTGFPGYDTVMGKETATIAEILRQQGWNTAWFGKNHNVPDWMSSQAGPFDLWPSGLGFEHFYGFIGGDTSQWRPALIEGTKPIEPYLGNPDYNLDDDLADQAIRWVENQKAVAPDRPFFLYYAPGATHAPHHPRPEWVAKYKGKFDQGWDKVREETFARQKKRGVIPAEAQLTPRPEQIPAWDSLDENQKKVYAHMMEIYAGFLEQTDHNVGRVLSAIENLGQLDDTLVIYIVGDNGASAEGSLQGLLNEMTFFNGVPEDIKEVLSHADDLGTWKTYNHYPVGWAHAMCTPFQWTKQVASHYGGTRNGMVISWPAHLKQPNRGGLRTQWHHIIDIAPTVLEACGLKLPASVNGVAQRPIEGVSMLYTLDNPKAPSRHTTQYFEMLGNRAIYHDGWVACTTPPTPPWDPTAKDVDVIDGYEWELYHVDRDFSQAENLASREPARLADMKIHFYAEAARYNVLPLDNSKIERLDPAIRPSLTRGRKSFSFSQGMSRIPEGASPDLKNKSFVIIADVEVPKDGVEGVIFTQGGLFAGMALYVEKGKPVFDYNFVDVAHYTIAGKSALSPGKHTLKLDFKYDGGGVGKGAAATLSVDGKQAATGRVEHTLPIRVALDEGLDVGQDTGTPVNLSYDVPFKFTGKISKLTVDLK